jgi:Icc-related predicted phosphoesterase
MDPELRRADGSGNAAVVRIAAVGDTHVGTDTPGLLADRMQHVAERADVLLLAGDLTQHGRAEEGRLVADELRRLGVPTLAVFGNHDYHEGCQDRIRSLLESAGVEVLEGQGTVRVIAGRRVGIAGVKGFGGGFAGACGTEFGEDEMKAFIRHTKQTAERLEECLKCLDCEIRIALTHYSPSKGTLVGEKLEIYPFLGSYLLGEAIDHGHCHLALHGHAHLGTERAVTPGGVPVRNVARPVIKMAYRVYAFGAAVDVPSELA